jgi:uncharacterized surface protein with fasciclin (FAS1) repeats
MNFAQTVVAALLLSATAASAENPMVGGAPMLETRNIVENAVNSADHTTLVAALPAGTVDTLLKPENKDLLTKILTAHVVAGDWSSADIARMARASADGFYHFNAVSGDALSAQAKGKKLYIYDENGNVGRITISDVKQSNGVIHVVDAILVPK